MSDDGTYILRRDGKERFFYERWGGSYIDRVMLRGLDGFFEHLEKTREFPAPFLDLWLCGLLVVDLDEREVMFFSGQFPARSVMEMRLLLELISKAWPGFKITPWQDPALELSRWLPEHPPVKALQPPRREWELEAFREMQNKEWAEAMESSDWTNEIAECGEAVVRGWFEAHSHMSVAFIFDAEGACHETTFADEWDASALISVGEGGIEILRERPAMRIEEVLCESQLDSAYWIDIEAREVRYWAERAIWSAHPLRRAQERWPGWSFQYEPGGAISMLERCGRDPRLLLDEDIQKRLREMLTRIYAPHPSGAEIVARAAAHIEAELEEGETLHITPPGPEHEAPRGDLVSWFWQTAEEILARDEFQPTFL